MKPWNIVAPITLISLGLGSGYAGFLLSDREAPVVVLSATPQAVAPAGGQLRIAYVLNRSRQCDTLVDRSIIDSRETRFVLPPFNFATGAGPIGQERYVSIVDIPDEATPGQAIYRTTTRYRCNALNAIWPIYSPTREVRFTVGLPRSPG